MTVPDVRVSADAGELATCVADRLLGRLGAIQAEGRVPCVVLTGGSIADAVHREVARVTAGLGSSPTPLVDWGLVEFWFGDERFVSADSPDRNVGHASAAMLSHLPVDPSRVHGMPASGGVYGDDVDAAAAAYAEDLRKAVGPGGGVTPTFDIVMLGIGPDGHCASLFPGRPEMYDDRPVVAVHNSPKPPPTRITLTLGPLQHAHEVWFIAAGEGKADAVRNAMSGADPHQIPAAGPKGLSRTLWFLDSAAASQLPC